MQIISNVKSSTLPIIIKIIRQYLVKNCKSWKLKSERLCIDELTVFINVSMDSLKAISKDIPEKVKKEVKINNEIINIITDKKYLLISPIFIFVSREKFLLTKILFGLTCEIKLFIENLNKEKSFKKRIPELVEKKEPPIITKIKKIKDKLFGFVLSENPIFEILLVNDKNKSIKLLSKFKKIKNILNKNKK